MMIYGWQNQGWGDAGWIWMILMMIVFWGLLVVGVSYIVRHFSHGAGMTQRSDSGAVDVLKMRFARGEIDAEEYQHRLTMLKEGQ